MLAVILKALSVIGIILLVLLGVFLAALLLVLFFPVSYRLGGRRDGEGIRAEARAGWLFGLLRAGYAYPEPGRLVVRLLSFTVFDSGAAKGAGAKSPGRGKRGSKSRRAGREASGSEAAENKGSEGRASESKASENAALESKTSENMALESKTSENMALESKTSENKALDGKTSENAVSESEPAKNKALEKEASGNNASESKTTENKAPEDKISENTAPKGKASENAAFEDRMSQDSTQEGKTPKEEGTEGGAAQGGGILSRLFAKYEKIKYTIRKIYDRIKDILENISYYRKLLEEEDTRKLFRHMCLRVGRVLKHIRPRRLEADILFGAPSPDTTGYVYALYGMIYPYLGEHIHVTPDFAQAVLEGRIDAAGHITVFQLLWNGILLLLDRRLKLFIRRVKPPAAGSREPG